MAPPIVNATVQSAALAAISNLLAQTLMAYRQETSLNLDWIPVFQFILYAVVSTPPNFIWQEFLESAYPAYAQDAPPAPQRDEKKAPLPAAAPELSRHNTAAKFLLDQTVGAAFNTFLFSVFMHSIQLAMASSPGGAGGRIDYGKVDWTLVLARSRAEFVPLVVAGWRLWPAVSLVNYAFVRTVEARNLVGSLAGVVWGVYTSLFAAS